MHTRLAAFASLGLLLTTALAAQQSLPLTPGQRVRVTAPSAGMHNEVATVGAISADTLVLDRTWAGQPLRSAVPLGSVQTLEVSRGEPGPCPYSVLGAVLGVGLGAISGAAKTTDVWEPVPLDRIRVGLAPLPSGRLGLCAAFSF